jgi:predicted NUDIX family NTP pyrophosphohydrolase
LHSKILAALSTSWRHSSPADSHSQPDDGGLFIDLPVAARIGSTVKGSGYSTGSIAGHGLNEPKQRPKFQGDVARHTVQACQTPDLRCVPRQFHAKAGRYCYAAESAIGKTITMVKLSAGIVVFRQMGAEIEVLLVHPGGPFWAKKDAGSWSIPKGLCDENEDALAAGRRELREETGIVVAGEFIELGRFKQTGGKTIIAWAIRGDFDPANLQSNTFPLEWPPKSGHVRHFPEIDRAAWFSIVHAATKITKGQLPILKVFAEKLLSRSPGKG